MSTITIYIQNNFFKVFYLFMFLSVSLYVGAQEESCTQTLIDAQDIFSKGQIEEVPLMLESCLQKGFNKQEKIDAYRLLTLCHLYYNRTKEAAVTMQNMLMINPEYKIRDIDPSEFINLYSSFNTSPIVMVGFKGGIGSFNMYNIRNFSDISSGTSTKTYTPELSVLGGISIEVPIIKHLSFVTGGYYSTFTYNYKHAMSGYSTITLNEKATGIQLPLLIQWNILKDRQLIPYVNVGTDLYYLLGSELINTSRTDTTSGQTPLLSESSQSIDVTSSRNIFNYSASAGIGVRWKIKDKGYLTFDVRYLRYMNEHVKKDNRADDPSLTYSYLYTDNSFKKEDIQFLIGYKLPFYRPRQRKSARIEN